MLRHSALQGARIIRVHWMPPRGHDGDRNGWHGVRALHIVAELAKFRPPYPAFGLNSGESSYYTFGLNAGESSDRFVKATQKSGLASPVVRPLLLSGGMARAVRPRVSADNLADAISPGEEASGRTG
ncbi:MAG: hypothetical protein R3C02_12170 [Planctomycetaceae bacterium]